MASMIMASTKTFISSIPPIPTPKVTPFPKVSLPTFPKPLQLPSSMDERGAAIREKLSRVRVTAADVKQSRIPLNRSGTSSGFRILEVPSFGFLKFLLMCGFFTLQTTEQALAGSDISTRLQPFSFLGDLGDISTGFASAFLLIFFSELGDKTFFIAALLAARNSAAVTFIGTFGALGVMTIISVIIGRTFHYVDGILPFRFGDADLPIDDLAAVCLLVYFGVSSLIDGSSSDGLKAEEEQKEAELAVSELSGSGAGILAAANTIFSTFLLVFVAEWGDKSFFSTIALAAASSPLGVVAGALAGHGVATLVIILSTSIQSLFTKEPVI